MLPETGSISMSQVNVELKKGETTVITLNDTDVRKLAGKPSGIISMEDLRGKKASESVNNYRLKYSILEGVDQKNFFTLNFPHKVISGTLKIQIKGGEGSVTINGEEFGPISHQTYITYSKNVPKGTTSWNCSERVKYNQNSNGSISETWIEYIIDFTGEWEL